MGGNGMSESLVIESVPFRNGIFNLKNSVGHELTRIFTNKPGLYVKTKIHQFGLPLFIYKILISFVFIRVNSWQKPVLGLIIW